MGRIGGEKMSRLSVGLFALALVGGGAAFFSGLLDSYFVDKQPVNAPPAAMPFAKPKPAAAPSAAAQPATPTPASPTEAAMAATPTAPVKAAAPAPTEVAQPLVSTLDERNPDPSTEVTDAPLSAKPTTVKPTRSRDLDMRNCLDLPTEMEVAQCAYKLQ